MGKKISDLSEDELANMDLDDLLRMSEEMQPQVQETKNKTTETLKKVGSKTFESATLD